MTQEQTLDSIDFYWDEIVNLMNDDIREQVHAELAPCGKVSFLKRYCELDNNFFYMLLSEFGINIDSI